MPRGVLYNVIRVTSLKPRGNETAKDFSQRIGSDIRSRPGFYFKRWETTVSEDDLTKFKEIVDHILELIWGKEDKENKDGYKKI